MNPIVLEMRYFGMSLTFNVNFWSEEERDYFPATLIFDTGAVKTTLSTKLLAGLGYDINCACSGGMPI